MTLGTDIDIGAKLHIAIGDLTEELRSQREREMAKQRAKQRLMPIDVPLIGSTVSPGSGTAYIGLGKPNQGFLWEVRSLIIGGALISSTPAGTAYFLVGPPQGLNDNADAAIQNLRDIANAAGSSPFPTVAFYGTRQFVVRPGEHLAVVILSPTASTTYVASGIALQYPIEAYDDVIEI